MYPSQNENLPEQGNRRPKDHRLFVTRIAEENKEMVHIKKYEKLTVYYK